MCEEKDAMGVVVEGVVYSINGKEEITDVDSVVVFPISEFDYQKEQQDAFDASALETQTTLAELSILIAQKEALV